MNSKARLLIDDSPGGNWAGTGPIRGIAVVFGIFLATRLVVWTATYSGVMINFRITQHIEPPLEPKLPDIVEKLREPDSPERQFFDTHVANLEPMLGFDSWHYRQILLNGYHGPLPQPGGAPDRSDRNLAFFPFYPLACSLIAPLVGVPAALVGVSNLCALLAGILLYLWIRRRVDEASARYAVAFLFCWPTACFFSYGYAEGLTVLLVVMTLVLADRGHFLLAAVACAAATATRPTALALAAVVMLAYWMRQSGPVGRRLVRTGLLGLVAAGGIAAYAGYLTYLYGTPLVYFSNFKVEWIDDEARSTWFQYLTMARVWDQFKYFGRAIIGFPEGLVHLTHPFAWNMPANFAILFVSLAGLTRVARSFRPYLLLGPLIFLHGYLASGGASFGVNPIARYTVVSVPAFVVLAAWCAREWKSGPRVVVLALLMLLQVTWAFHFGLGEWPG